MTLLPSRLASQQALSLDEVLLAREARQLQQQLWLARHATPLLSFSVLAPGAIKDSVLTRRIFNEGWQSLQQLISDMAWPLLAEQVSATPLGGYGLIALNVDALQLKLSLVALEERHPLGRLWDLDVIKKDGRPLSRQTFAAPPRRCLICERPASECARTRRHSTDTLLIRMEAQINACCPQ
ncbi:citrate lyase holo-[acyl-carrier protein] synthase [Citrobacter amalonaticus]|uniref:Apo-citrate lyase phosphoribosyl-dephospho-CoA transferase n=1 Tax=Citrobacter amalonaticus TaxID=35703 RepID=A0A2S4RR28_CITAM|nr:citrate lyase holo-[acyl-carrier protein] synthase [Citrobacter amalonaticus]POT54616.1 citrate lyase holo-[acyl-carrier protein] synthase [Citrobacter amalonaticus]POT69562.1 citrate lyase holo-[acyl-carrier protein] synthase [Citrobacter amalonaticus]POU60373.1 citrate lyase holo-[acyl-carrier protein] synthase [Citrobacter amalonaticus]POV02668.1 citrate lyase holo-[acyl-carrier protein] synthase [Citrobacter amalonaticus]